MRYCEGAQADLVAPRGPKEPGQAAWERMLGGIEAERDRHWSMLWMFPLPHTRMMGSGREPLRPTRVVRARSLFRALALLATTVWHARGVAMRVFAWQPTDC